MFLLFNKRTSLRAKIYSVSPVPPSRLLLDLRTKGKGGEEGLEEGKL